MLKFKRMVLLLGVLIGYSLVFINEAPAPPPPPPPPAPAGGDIAQGIAVGMITLYGVWRFLRKK